MSIIRQKIKKVVQEAMIKGIKKKFKNDLDVKFQQKAD